MDRGMYETGRGGQMVDDSGLHDINEEDLESREKPKVTYICGGKYTHTHSRIRRFKL